MRKIAAILLLTCLGLILCGFSVVFHSRMAGTSAIAKSGLRSQRRVAAVQPLTFFAPGALPLFEAGSTILCCSILTPEVIENKLPKARRLTQCAASKEETAFVPLHGKEIKNGNWALHQNIRLARLLAASFMTTSGASLFEPEKPPVIKFSRYPASVAHRPGKVLTPPPNGG